jgi:hypothetical protein
MGMTPNCLNKASFVHLARMHQMSRLKRSIGCNAMGAINGITLLALA